MTDETKEFWERFTNDLNLLKTVDEVNEVYEYVTEELRHNPSLQEDENGYEHFLEVYEERINKLTC